MLLLRKSREKNKLEQNYREKFLCVEHKKTRLAEKLGIRVLSQTHLNQHKQYENQLCYHSPNIELSINNEQCYNVNDTQARLSLKEIATDINNGKYVVRIELL